GNQPMHVAPIRLRLDLRRLLKHWSESRVEAEGADGKERARRIPAMGLQRASDAPRRPFCLAPHGLRSFWRWPTLLAWSRWQGYRHCARALASAKRIATRPTPVFQQSPKTMAPRKCFCQIRKSFV